MSAAKTSTTYKAVANRAKEFIGRHWRDDLTLERIAAHVYLSPFHFQRIFKQETGESPKNYLTRLRIDGSVVMLTADRDKPVYDIAIECGFSSQSVFTRSFHRRFGMSPTAFRGLSLPQIAKLATWDPAIQRLFLDQLRGVFTPAERKKFLASIRVERIETIRVVCQLTTMKSEKHIAGEFRSFADKVSAYDLPTVGGECYGLMNDFPLHTPQEKCRYRVCLRVPPGTDVPPGFFSMEIQGGKYVVFPVRGNIGRMVEIVVFFFNEWMKKGTYKIADLYWFERFSAMPTKESYSTATREYYIPIKPA